MNTTLSGSEIEWRYVPAKAVDSIRNSEVDSNEISESDSRSEKHTEQRISILKGIVTSWSQPEYRINFERDESTIECEFHVSIEICEI
jgi:hypothetical protein